MIDFERTNFEGAVQNSAVRTVERLRAPRFFLAL
jgi:hypothetical protein